MGLLDQEGVYVTIIFGFFTSILWLRHVRVRNLSFIPFGIKSTILNSRIRSMAMHYKKFFLKYGELSLVVLMKFHSMLFSSLLRALIFLGFLIYFSSIPLGIRLFRPTFSEYFWLVVVFSITVHELGHALVSESYMREIVGILILYIPPSIVLGGVELTPIPHYSEEGGMSYLPLNKKEEYVRHDAIISSAGLFINLLFCTIGVVFFFVTNSLFWLNVFQLNFILTLLNSLPFSFFDGKAIRELLVLQSQISRLSKEMP